MNYFDQIREKIRSPVRVSILTEEMMWSHHDGTLMWQADRFEGVSHFNSIYQWNDFYSYSYLALLLKKGTLSLNKNAYKKAMKEDFLSLYAFEMIDTEIKKIGGPAMSDMSINDPDDYLRQIADAMKTDIKIVEENNPGYVQIVLCGGKDSMNTLLLPFKNPVIALSAKPNYQLVCEFVKRNNLDIEVRMLDDTYDPELLVAEVAECCCRMELSNWKWGRDLKDIAREFDQKVIFWQGQYSEILLSTDWKHMIWPKNAFNNFWGKIFRISSPYLPKFIKYPIGELIAPLSAVRAWNFTSVKLGDHMAFLRSICDALVLTPYMGPNMTKLYKSVNHARAVQYDRRAELGPLLAGRSIWYPDENPGPPLSPFRRREQTPDKFIKLLKQNGVEVVE